MDKRADSPAKGERIAKVLARAGLCSRREAERWITAGRVAVDGRKLISPAVNVTAAARVTVDGKPVAAAGPARLWRYHKPAGLVTSHRDPQGRPTVFDRLPDKLPRVISVGRLDLTSEGLLLLTNAGDLARRLERPENGWTRRYRVRVFGAVDEAALARLADGLSVDGLDYGPLDARLDSRRGRNAWLTVSLKEGRNREVRRVMEHLGLTVNRLIRIAFGPFQLGRLKRGAVGEVRGKVLREQLGADKPS
ncbi:MAG: pseudouridine synthase [Rhodospirillales bacterium]|nr:pseudouridine synthase [Rhodospirillales bacterium]MDP6885136.1 pseudouridine synthase [Rhodospirillales bacterium]